MVIMEKDVFSSDYLHNSLIISSSPSTELLTGDIMSFVSTSGRSWNSPVKKLL